MPSASYLTFFHSFFLSFRSSPYEILLKATRVYKDKILYMVYETLEEVSVSQWTAQSHMITHTIMAQEQMCFFINRHGQWNLSYPACHAHLLEQEDAVSGYCKAGL